MQGTTPEFTTLSLASMLTTTPAYSNLNLFNETVCEASEKTINCSSGVIKILNAFYGRVDNTTCCSGWSSDYCSNTACYSNKTEYFKGICDSQKTCTIQTSFEDPCFMNFKYVWVSWECKSKFFIFLK